MRGLRGALTLAGVAAVAAAVAAAAPRVPQQAPAYPAAVPLPVTATVPVQLCPGPETMVAPEGGRPEPAPGVVTVASVADGGAGAATLGALVPGTGGGAPVVSHPKVAAPVGLLPVAAAGAVRFDLTRGETTPAGAATQATSATSGDLRGLAAIACGPALADSWLVGGGTGTGERTRLLLANPTPAAALVDVVVHGEDGRVDAPQGEGVVVPSGQQVALYVDALAPDAGPVAVNVTARSGRVVAVLHHTRMLGITPGGVDDVGPAAPPGTDQVVPGVVVAPPGSARVRVVATGSRPTVVQVTLQPADGTAGKPLALGVVTVTPGAARDVEVPAATPAGTYTARVHADGPVAAGALVLLTPKGGEIAGTSAGLGKKVPPTELAWVGAAVPLRGAVRVAVPRWPGVAAPAASLVIARGGPSSGASAGPATVSVTPLGATGAAGEPIAVEVASSGSVSVALPAGSVGARITTAEAAAPVYATLLVTPAAADGPMVSAVAVRPGAVRREAPTLTADPRLGLPAGVQRSP